MSQVQFSHHDKSCTKDELRGVKPKPARNNLSLSNSNESSEPLAMALEIIQGLEQQLTDSKEKVRWLELSSKTYEETISTLEEKFHAASAEIDELLNDIHSLWDYCDRQESQNVNLKRVVEQLSTEKCKILDDMDRMREGQEMVKSVNDRIKELQEMSRRKISRITEENDLLKARNKELELKSESAQNALGLELQKTKDLKLQLAGIRRHCSCDATKRIFQSTSPTSKANLAQTRNLFGLNLDRPQTTNNNKLSSSSTQIRRVSSVEAVQVPVRLRRIHSTSDTPEAAVSCSMRKNGASQKGFANFETNKNATWNQTISKSWHSSPLARKESLTTRSFALELPTKHAHRHNLKHTLALLEEVSMELCSDTDEPLGSMKRNVNFSLFDLKREQDSREKVSSSIKENNSAETKIIKELSTTSAESLSESETESKQSCSQDKKKQVDNQANPRLSGMFLRKWHLFHHHGREDPVQESVCSETLEIGNRAESTPNYTPEEIQDKEVLQSPRNFAFPRITRNKAA